MLSKSQAKSYRRIVAIILSIIIPGTGEIYLHRIFKGFALVLSFGVAIAIIWSAVAGGEFKLFNWRGNAVMFSTSKHIFFGGQVFKVADIMKFTGTIQLIFTWVFSIIDAWIEGGRQS